MASFESFMFLSLPNGGFIASNRIVCMWNALSRSGIKYLQQAKQTNTFIDLTGGRPVLTIILTDYGMTIGVAQRPTTVGARLNGQLYQYSRSLIDNGALSATPSDTLSFENEEFAHELVSETGKG